MFQSTPPHGRRPAASGMVADVKMFQSTPPHGRRPGSAPETAHHYRGFQSTPPHGRRPTACFLPILGWRFQSTPPHGRRRRIQGRAQRKRQVSIHASAREATQKVVVVIRRVSRFNPRLRTGGDHGDRVGVCSGVVSIHASAREATLTARKIFDTEIVSIHASAREATAVRPRCACRELFQSTPPHGRRLSTAFRSLSISRGFQSTPPHGRRHLLHQFVPQHDGFNPRLRTGGDGLSVAVCSREGVVSIHASAREATTL